MITPRDVLHQSFEDIYQDSEQLRYLYGCLRDRVKQFERQLDTVRRHLRPSSCSEVKQRIKNLRSILEVKLKELSDLQKQIHRVSESEETLTGLTEEKDSLFELYRIHQLETASLICSLDWQSPSFMHTHYSQAGKQTGLIVGTINDYKRDRHLDAVEYEKAFVKEFIDAPVRFTVRPYLTSSGMAAFTTILDFLTMEGKVNGPVIVGKNCYFQNKHLICKLLPDRVIEAEESDTNGLLQTIRETSPSVIYLDSLCNTLTVTVPDILAVIQYLKKYNKRDVYLLIDNTGLTTAFQPIRHILGNLRRIHLIQFESLNKYHQFGTDRVTAGMICAVGKDTAKLFDYREHSGANIPDLSVYALPLPSREHFDLRLKRLQRNANFMAQLLYKDCIQNTSSAVEQINYPMLPSHPAYKYCSEMSFRGSFFSLQFAQRYRTVRTYQKFLQKVMREARKQNLQLFGGTSFGLPVSRIYLTALRTDFTEPFIRISAGTENMLQIQRLAGVLKEVISTI